MEEAEQQARNTRPAEARGTCYEIQGEALVNHTSMAGAEEALVGRALTSSTRAVSFS